MYGVRIGEEEKAPGRATSAPCRHAQGFPNQPSGSSRPSTTRSSRAFPGSMARTSSAVPSVERSSTTMISQSTPRSRVRLATHASMLWASFRAGTMMETAGAASSRSALVPWSPSGGRGSGLGSRIPKARKAPRTIHGSTARSPASTGGPQRRSRERSPTSARSPAQITSWFTFVIPDASRPILNNGRSRMSVRHSARSINATHSLLEALLSPASGSGNPSGKMEIPPSIPAEASRRGMGLAPLSDARGCAGPRLSVPPRPTRGLRIAGRGE
jgi:hypothetical protein